MNRFMLFAVLGLCLSSAINADESKYSKVKAVAPIEDADQESEFSKLAKKGLNNPVSGAALWATLGRVTSSSMFDVFLPVKKDKVTEQQVKGALLKAGALGLGVCYSGCYFTHTGTGKELGMKMALATAAGALSMKWWPIKTPDIAEKKGGL
jgi:hypothetical protein